MSKFEKCPVCGFEWTPSAMTGWDCPACEASQWNAAEDRAEIEFSALPEAARQRAYRIAEREASAGRLNTLTAQVLLNIASR